MAIMPGKVRLHQAVDEVLRSLQASALSGKQLYTKLPKLVYRNIKHVKEAELIG